MSPPLLAGRGAVVTGGGRGIGASIARALASEGVRVVVAARSELEIAEVAGGLRALRAEAWPVACDVTDEVSVRRLGEESRKLLGAVSILIHSAGGAASAPLQRITLEEWDRLLELNATSAFLCAREFVPAMAEAGWGRIVIVASVAGLEGGRYIAHYAASKHAVIGLTRSIAAELAGTGVTVNALCPAYVDTPMTERTIENVEALTGRSRAEALAAVLATTGQERLIRPEEVAAEALRLCREESGDRTGQAVVLSAGGSG